jgi:hypothetical protein
MREVFRQIPILLKIRELWLGLYFLKFGLSLLVVIPFYLVNNSVLSSSIFSQTLIESWDFSVLIEMFFGRGEVFSQYLIFVFIGLVIYVAIWQFLNGGVYYLFVSGRLEKINWRDFFAECGIGFNMHLKITMMMLVVYALLLFAGMFFVNIISMAGGHLVGKAVLIMDLFKLSILMLIMLAASIFSDAVRATASAFLDKPFRENMKIASEYFKSALRRLFKIYLITFVSFLIFWGAAGWLSMSVIDGVGGLIGISIEIILFQMISFVRNGQKLWYLTCFGKDYISKYQGRFLPEQISLNL